MKKIIFYTLFLLLNTILIFSFLFGDEKPNQEGTILYDDSLLSGLKWICIGPANMGGRFDDIAFAK